MRLPKLTYYTSPPQFHSSRVGRTKPAHNLLIKTRWHSVGLRLTIQRADPDLRGEPMTVLSQFSITAIHMSRGIECPICHWNTDKLSGRLGIANDQSILDTHMEACRD